MKCEKCNNKFSVGRHIGILYSIRTERTYYFCSEKCSKEFEKEYPANDFIRVDKGGKE